MTFTTEELIKIDRDRIWHPYTSVPASTKLPLVRSASGVHLHLDSGDSVVDGMSSWWAAIHGYNHSHLNQAIEKQLKQMSHIMFGGLTHEPAIRLAEKLTSMTKLDHVFYCDSGSVAIEVAMKMALQYFHNSSSQPSRTKFLTIRGGYHGDTFECMSVCDPDNGMHSRWTSILSNQLFCQRPQIRFDDDDWDESDIDEFRLILEQHSSEICSVILEPIVQGAGGMRMYHPMYLKRVRELCDEHGALLIADEIATGFGRTGKLFACEWAGMKPDILCLGKALSGGYLSFAATMTSAKVAEQIGILLHGPTFMANPLACAVSLASLEILETSEWKSQVAGIEAQLRDELLPCLDLPSVSDVRVLGAIGVVELKEPIDMKTMQPWILDQGVWLRPFGRLLYTMPPFITKKHELELVTQTMVKVAKKLIK